MQITNDQRPSKNMSPFDWRLSVGPDAQAESKPRERPRKAAEPRLSVRARTERILAQRWGNPYCKPGMPRVQSGT